MEVFLDSTEYKRIDLCYEYNNGQIKERKFVVKSGNFQRAFDSLIDAVEFYNSINAEICQD